MTGGKAPRRQIERHNNNGPSVRAKRYNFICKFCNAIICSWNTIQSSPPFIFDVKECSNLRVEDGGDVFCSNCNHKLGFMIDNGTHPKLIEIIQIEDGVNIEEEPER